MAKLDFPDPSQSPYEENGYVYEWDGSKWNIVATPGSGVNLTLQDVTDNGNTTNNEILVSNSGNTVSLGTSGTLFLDSGNSNNAAVLRIRQSGDNKFSVTGDGGCYVGGVRGAAPISLNANGSSTFDGNLQVGGNPNSAIATGTQLTTNAGLWASAATGTTSVLRGYTTGTDVITSRINANGTAEFAGRVQVGGDPNSGANDGVEIDPTSAIIATGTGTTSLWRTFANGSATITSRIRADGAAEFAGNVTTGAALYVNADGTRNNSQATLISYADDGSTATGALYGDGKLLLGNSTTDPNISLNADGSAEFSGLVTVGDSAFLSGANSTGNLNIRNDGDGSSPVYEVYNGGFQVAANRRVTINADGSASFAGPQTLGSASSPAINGYTSLIDNTEASTAACFAGNNYNADGVIFLGVDGSNGDTITTTIKNNGSADFKGRVSVQRDTDTDAGLLIKDAAGNNEHILYGTGAASFNEGKIIFSAGGSATFAGSVQTGGDARTGTAMGIQLDPTGTVSATTNSGTGTLWEGYTTGGAVTSSISANGSATFAGDVIAPNLPDYEEGTWTPTAQTGNTLSSVIATYIKVGNLVWFSLTADLTTTGAPGSAHISGLPFHVKSGGSRGAYPVRNVDNITDSNNGGAYVNGNTIYLQNSVGTGSASSKANITNVEFGISGCYEV